jgi:hypothetical protein
MTSFKPTWNSVSPLYSLHVSWHISFLPVEALFLKLLTNVNKVICLLLTRSSVVNTSDKLIKCSKNQGVGHMVQDPPYQVSSVTK